MKKIWLIVWIIVLLLITQFGENNNSTALNFTEIPTDFGYDGCSRFPDGDYGECCIEHDQYYFFGGHWQERIKADNKLFQCVRNKWKLYHKILAPAMWIGVRIGWAPIWPTSYRWWFGRDL